MEGNGRDVDNCSLTNPRQNTGNGEAGRECDIELKEGNVVNDSQRGVMKTRSCHSTLSVFAEIITMVDEGKSMDVMHFAFCSVVAFVPHKALV